MIFVLVHGAWHGGWCYRKVAQRLRAAGHEVYTPTLTGLGERSHLMNRAVTLDTHIEDVVNLIRWEELSDVILCGHSYGGMVITGVADRIPERLRALVYLDAIVPASGQCLFDFVAPETAQAMRDDARQNGDGYLMTPIPAAVFNVNPADAAWVDRLCVKHPIISFERRPELSGAGEKVAKRTFVLAPDWPPPGTPGLVSPFLEIAESLKKDPRWRVVTVQCGHDLMVDKPDEVAQVLIASA